jgi:hypothetical protein
MSKPTPKPPVLTEGDLTVIAEGVPALDPFPMRPWNRERLLAACLTST